MSASDPEFEAAFDHLLAKAYRLALRMVGDRALAEDIAAETMARTFAHWRRVRGYEHLDAWVSRVASNLAITAVGKAGALDPRLVRGRCAAGRRRPARCARSTRCSICRAVSARSSRCATSPIRAKAAIASQLGVSAGSVKTHLHRGIGALRRALGPDFALDIEESA